MQKYSKNLSLYTLILATAVTFSGSLAFSKPVRGENKPLDNQKGEIAQVNPEPAQSPFSLPTEPTPDPRILVGEVEVIGVEGELKDLVYRSIKTEPGRTTTRSQLQEDVRAIYTTGYFGKVNVAPEDTPLGVKVVFTIEANPLLKQVVIETAPKEESKTVVPPEVMTKIFSPLYGQILNLEELKEKIKELNKWYTENGYDLAQVVGSPEIGEDGTVTLVITEGVIEDIQVRFFKEEEPVKGKTRDFIVTREIQLKPGDVFNRQKAQKDLQRVYGLGLFEDAKFSFAPGTDPNKVVVNVDLVEGSSGSIAAGAGISSTSGLFGTVSYQQRNLGGNNQTLSTEVQIGTREFLFDSSFTDPWIAGDPYRTSYSVNIFRRKTISLVYAGDDKEIKTENGDDEPRVVRTGGGVSFSRPLPANPFGRSDWRLSTGFQYQHVQIENSDGDIAPRARAEDNNIKLAFSDSGEDDLFLFNFGATSDHRDDPLQPTKGSIFRLGVDQSVPLGSGSIFFARLRGSYSYYIPVKYINFPFSEGAQTIAFNLQAGTVIGDLPPYEAFVVGGSNSVRGYAEGEVGSGRTYVQATAEYRFPIFKFIGGAAFLDYGTTLGSGDAVPGNPSGIRDLPGSGLGYGLGVRIRSPIGPIRIDYGLNDNGDSRINFGIGEKF